MRRFLSLIILFGVFGYVLPTMVLAESVVTDQTVTQTCPIDGYVSTSIDQAPVPIESAGQPLVTSVTVHNDSAQFSFAGVSVGVALYEEGVAQPAYWAPLADDVLLLPSQRQTFDVVLDASFVGAGEYDLRVGAAQGGQLTALAHSQQTNGQKLQKQIDGNPLLTTLTVVMDSVPVVGDHVTYTLTTENTTDTVMRDYEQTLVGMHGRTPVGSAVQAVLPQPVKMIPGSVESLSLTHTIKSPGTHSVIGFSNLADTLLPVAREQFVVGDQVESVTVFTPGVGITGLDSDDPQLQVTTCVAALPTDVADVVEVEHLITTDDSVVDTQTGRLHTGAGLSAYVSKKDELTDLTVVTSVFAIAIDSTTGVSTTTRGSLLYRTMQTVSCSDQCQLEPNNSLGAPILTNATPLNLWLYVFAVLGGLALLYIVITIWLQPAVAKSKDGIDMHQPEE